MTRRTSRAAIQGGISRFPTEQWAFWPLGSELEARLHQVLAAHFDDLFTQTAGGYTQTTWVNPGREVLITWESRHSHL